VREVDLSVGSDTGHSTGSNERPLAVTYLERKTLDRRETCADHNRATPEVIGRAIPLRTLNVSRSLTHATVDALAQQVGVSTVTCVLLDLVHQ
jgi:hypothetical protein